jgi:hypothetical protein
MWDPSALTEEDIDEIVHSAEQPGGNTALENPAALAVGAQAYLDFFAAPQAPSAPS